MLRTISHIGNSYGVTIPKEIIDKLHLTAGTQVDVQLDEEADRIIIKPVAAKAEYQSIDAEFASQVSDFIEKYRPALKELAK